MLGEFWALLPPERFPHTLALIPHLFEGGPDEQFEFGLDGSCADSNRSQRKKRSS
jgi:hypothetical protein